MLSLTHLRTLFTALFIALVIVACGGGGSGASSANLEEDYPEEVTTSEPVSQDDLGEDVDADGELADFRNRLEITQFEFVEVVPISEIGHGDSRPIAGEPSAGQQYDVVIGTQGAVGEIEFSTIDTEGSKLGDIEIISTSKFRENGNAYHAKITVPITPFVIRAEGLMSDGRVFSEIYDREFFPQYVTISLPVNNYFSMGEDRNIEIFIETASSDFYGEYVFEVSSSDRERFQPVRRVVDINSERHLESVSFSSAEEGTFLLFVSIASVENSAIKNSLQAWFDISS